MADETTRVRILADFSQLGTESERAQAALRSLRRELQATRGEFSRLQAVMRRPLRADVGELGRAGILGAEGRPVGRQVFFPGVNVPAALALRRGLLRRGAARELAMLEDILRGGAGLGALGLSVQVAASLRASEQLNRLVAELASIGALRPSRLLGPTGRPLVGLFERQAVALPSGFRGRITSEELRLSRLLEELSKAARVAAAVREGLTHLLRGIAQAAGLMERLAVEIAGALRWARSLAVSGRALAGPVALLPAPPGFRAAAASQVGRMAEALAEAGRLAGLRNVVDAMAGAGVVQKYVESLQDAEREIRQFTHIKSLERRVVQGNNRDLGAGSLRLHAFAGAAKGASAGISALGQALRDAGRWLLILGGGGVLFGATRALGRLASFGVQMEQLRIGVAETLSVTARLFDVFGRELPASTQVVVALRESDRALDALATNAARFGLNLETLAETYTVTAGSARAANVSLEDQIRIITLLSVLGERLNITGAILRRDIRDIFQASSGVARTLLANALQLEQTQLRQKIQTGEFARFMLERLAIVEEAAELNLSTVRGLANAISAVLRQLARRISPLALIEIRDFLSRILGYLLEILDSPRRIRELATAVDKLTRSFLGAVEALTRLAALLSSAVGGPGSLAALLVGGVLGARIGARAGREAAAEVAAGFFLSARARDEARRIAALRRSLEAPELPALARIGEPTGLAGRGLREAGTIAGAGVGVGLMGRLGAWLRARLSQMLGAIEKSLPGPISRAIGGAAGGVAGAAAQLRGAGAAVGAQLTARLADVSGMVEKFSLASAFRVIGGITGRLVGAAAGGVAGALAVSAAVDWIASRIERSFKSGAEDVARGIERGFLRGSDQVEEKVARLLELPLRRTPPEVVEAQIALRERILSQEAAVDLFGRRQRFRFVQVPAEPLERVRAEMAGLEELMDRLLVLGRTLREGRSPAEVFAELRRETGLVGTDVEVTDRLVRGLDETVKQLARDIVLLGDEGEALEERFNRINTTFLRVVEIWTELRAQGERLSETLRELSAQAEEIQLRTAQTEFETAFQRFRRDPSALSRQLLERARRELNVAERRRLRTRREEMLGELMQTAGLSPEEAAMARSLRRVLQRSFQAEQRALRERRAERLAQLEESVAERSARAEARSLRAEETVARRRLNFLARMTELEARQIERAAREREIRAEREAIQLSASLDVRRAELELLEEQALSSREQVAVLQAREQLERELLQLKLNQLDALRRELKDNARLLEIRAAEIGVTRMFAVAAGQQDVAREALLDEERVRAEIYDLELRQQDLENERLRIQGEINLSLARQALLVERVGREYRDVRATLSEMLLDLARTGDLLGTLRQVGQRIGESVLKELIPRVLDIFGRVVRRPTTLERAEQIGRERQAAAEASQAAGGLFGSLGRLGGGRPTGAAAAPAAAIVAALMAGVGGVTEALRQVRRARTRFGATTRDVFSAALGGSIEGVFEVFGLSGLGRGLNRLIQRIWRRPRVADAVLGALISPILTGGLPLPIPGISRLLTKAFDALGIFQAKTLGTVVKKELSKIVSEAGLPQAAFIRGGGRRGIRAKFIEGALGPEEAALLAQFGFGPFDTLRATQPNLFAQIMRSAVPGVTRETLPGALALGAILFGAEGGPRAAVNAANALTNNLVAMGVSAKEARRQLLQLAQSVNVDVASGLQQLQALGFGGQFSLEQIQSAAEGLVRLFTEDLPGSLDLRKVIRENIRQTADGVLVDMGTLLETLEKAIQRVGEMAGAIGEALTQAIETTDLVQAGRSLAERFAGTFSQSLVQELLRQDAVAGALNRAAELAGGAAAALATGDRATFSRLAEEARRAFLSGQRTFFATASRVMGPAAAFAAGIGLGRGGLINQTGIGLPSFQTETYRVTPGPRRLPRIGTFHGGETVRAPEHEDRILKGLSDLARAIASQAGTGTTVEVKIDSDVIARALIRRSRRSGNRSVGPNAQLGVA